MNLTLNALSSDLTTLDPTTSKNPKKLDEAAQQFESLMIAQMMKSARDSSGGGWLSEGDETGEDSSMSMAEEQFAQAMAKSGGLGLAKMVVKAMSNVVSKTDASSVDVTPSTT